MLHTARDKVAAFKSKIQLYHRRVQVGNTIMFPQMTPLLDALPGNECNFCEEISAHLLAVNEAIQNVFQSWMTAVMIHGPVDHCQ